MKQQRQHQNVRQINTHGVWEKMESVCEREGGLFRKHMGEL